jgi:hypothetical protein
LLPLVITVGFVPTLLRPIGAPNLVLTFVIILSSVFIAFNLFFARPTQSN